MLVEMLDRETLVALAIKPLHFLRPVDRNPLARRLAEPAVQKPASPSSHPTPRPAAERPLAHPEQLCRLFLIELRRFPPVKKVQNIAMRTASSASLRRTQTLQKESDLPDTSRAT